MRCLALWRRAVGVGLALFGCGGFGCQALLDTDAQCEQSADCELRFGPGHVCGAGGVCSAAGTSTGSSPIRAALPESWACVNKPGQALASDDPQRRLHLRLAVYDYTTAEPVAGVRARACAYADVACSRPVGADQTAGSDGTVEFELPYGFDGHFELTAKARVPLIMSDGPLTQNATAQIPMLTADALTAMAERAGEGYEPTRGSVLLDLLDCNGAPAEGVRLEAVGAQGNRPLYFNAQLPTRELGGTRVSSLGKPPEPAALAGFINIKPGIVTFRAALEAGGQQLTNITLQVRAQTLTLTRFRPGIQ